MKDSTNFSGFDFYDIWNIDPEINDGYPFLRGVPVRDPETETNEPKPIPRFSFSYSGGELGQEGNYSSICYYTDMYFAESSYKYNHELATMSLSLSMAAFGVAPIGQYVNKAAHVRHLLDDLGYKDINTDLGYPNKPTIDSIGAVFAHKPIEGTNYEVLVIVVRGGGYEAEWGGNFRLGLNDAHEGFQIATRKVQDHLAQYISSQKNKFLHKEIVLWITGYSRGSAVANLLGAHFVKNRSLTADISLKRENIYTYCFETPAVSKSNDWNDPIYKNIFSIINPNDFVPKFPPGGFSGKWNYHRYGNTIFLPS